MGCLSIKCVVLWVNGLLALFAFIAMAIASAAIFNFSEDSFYSKEGYAIILAGSLLTFLITFFAVCDIRKDDSQAPSKIFIYWFAITIIFIANMAGFYYFRVFFAGLEPSSGDISQVLEQEAAKELQDAVLSSYTACCSGCDTSIPELLCTENIAPIAGCVSDRDTLRDVNTTCTYAEPCNSTQQAVNQGLGQGCYTSASEIPNYPVGSDTCKTLGLTDFDGKPLVSSPAGGGCGGGDPTKYLEDVFAYIDSFSRRILVGWGFLITMLGIASVGSAILIACPQLRERK